MTETFIELTEDEFEARFPLVVNHLNPTAGWCSGDGGCLFETFGEELEFVNSQDVRQIWTLVDDDNGKLYVISGPHLVNRLGYLISSESIPEGVRMQVHIPRTIDEREAAERNDQ